MATTPIGVGRGQAQVLDVPRATKYVDTKAQAQKAANIQKAKEQKTALDKIMDVDFDLGWQEHDNQIQTQIDNYRNKIVGWSKKGGDMTDPDFQRVVKTEQDRIGLLARKSEEDKANYQESRDFIQGDDRFSEVAEKNLYNTVFDEGGNAKDAWNIDKQEMVDVRNDSSGYNMLEVYKQMYTDMPSKLDNVIREWNPDIEGVLSKQVKDQFRGKAFKIVDGKKVLDADTPEGRALARQDEFMNNYVTQQMKAGKTEEEAFRGWRNYTEGGIGETQTRKTTKESAASRGGLSQKDFDNAMKFKEQVTQVVQGATEFYNAKEVNRVRGRDLPMDSGSFVQDIDESGMYDVLYKVNSAGEQVILDIVDFSDMDEAREKIVRHMKFLQAPTASELEKTPPYIPKGKREEDLARSEWLFTDPTQFEVSEEEATDVKKKRDDALIEDSHKQLGKGDKGAKKLTEALKGKPYKDKIVDRVEKRGIAKSGWQIIYFTDGTQMVIGGQEGNEEVLDEIIRGGEAIAPTELTEGGLDDI